VRVLLDPSGGFDLRPGEILVAPFTDPAWTPLFVAAAAVVVETGSLLSHASIVARELGRPSVVAVPGVTRLLRDGQQVEVDGTRGLVRIL
jgi:rifampicin phosphotransferase